MKKGCLIGCAAILGCFFVLVLSGVIFIKVYFTGERKTELVEAAVEVGLDIAEETTDAEAKIKILTAAGLMYVEGKGVQKDEQKGFKLIKQAVELDTTNLFPEAKIALARSYLKGIGTERNKVEGIRLLKEAAETGNVKGQLSFGKCWLNGICSENNPDYQQALYWLRKAGEKDDPEALFLLGVMWREGSGIEKDEAQGLNLIKLSAQKGNKEATQYLEKLQQKNK